MGTARDVWITDLRPAMGDRGECVPYRLDGREGHMLRLEDGDEEIRRLPSPARGWCEIHLGFVGASGIQLRLAVFPRGYEWSLYFTDSGEGRADLVPFGELDGWRVLREARDLYCQGADAADVWEMGHAPVRLDRWNALKRIGDREMLEQEFGRRIGGLMGAPEEPRHFCMETG